MCKSAPSEKPALHSLLPDNVNGWEAVEDQEYDRKTIFDYIDGAGEVYLAYDFEKLFSRLYVREGRPDIIADLFDMKMPENAYGVFTHDLYGEEIGIGQGSTFRNGLLTFWKGPIFVSIFCEEGTDEVQEALQELGRILSSRIESAGSIPPVVTLLPQENLDKHSVHFLFNPIILNYHYYIADKNILLLEPDTPAVIAAYGKKEGRYRLLIVQYPDKTRAEDAFQSFSASYMPDAKNHIIRTENDLWTAAQLIDRHVVVVFDAPSADAAREIIEGIPST